MHNLLDRVSAQLGSKRRRLGKMPAGPGLRGCGRLARARHRQQVGIRMLNPGQTLGRLHHPLQTLIVELVGGGPGSTSVEGGPHRDRVIFFRDILMDGVVGEAGQGRFPAIDQGFDFIGGRILF